MSKVDISVQELVNKVRRGELMLPETQRRYIWPATRVRDLLDSLYRSYPSGTILVWETDEEIETRELAVRPKDLPATSQKLLLLDGQQRITSLAAALSGEAVHTRSKNPDKKIEILFNLEHPEGPPVEVMEIEDDEFTADVEDVEEEEDAERDIQEEFKKRTFIVATRSLAKDPLWVLVSDIFTKTESQILRAIGINSNDERWDKYSERLKKVRDIGNYMYVMQVLEKSMSYEEVTEIFVRVNSLGIKLRGSDLAFAQITSKWKGFMKTIEDFAGQFDDDENYIIETGLPVRMIVALATHQSKFKTVGKISKTRLQNSWEKAKDGLEFAINFLRSNAEIENLSHLSSPFLIIPIAVYSIIKEGKLSKDDEKKLLKWFYYAHMRGHYSMGSSESLLDGDLSILYKKKNIDDLINQLHLHVKKFEIDMGDIVNRNRRSPFFSMLYFVLKQNGAMDWWSGLKLSEKHRGDAHKIQYHHIFPKSLLKNADYDTKEINDMANLAFIGGKTNREILNKEPIDYLENKVIPKRGEEGLKSQLITLDRGLWEIKNYGGFLVWRRKAIVDAINKFMKKFEK